MILLWQEPVLPTHILKCNRVWSWNLIECSVLNLSTSFQFIFLEFVFQEKQNLEIFKVGNTDEEEGSGRRNAFTFFGFIKCIFANHFANSAMAVIIERKERFMIPFYGISTFKKAIIMSLTQISLICALAVRLKKVRGAIESQQFWFKLWLFLEFIMHAPTFIEKLSYFVFVLCMWNVFKSIMMIS